MDVLQLYDKQIAELAKGMREEFSLHKYICDLIKEQKCINEKLGPLLNKEELTPTDRLIIASYDSQLEQIKTALDFCSGIYPKKFPME